MRMSKYIEENIKKKNTHTKKPLKKQGLLTAKEGNIN